MKSKFGHRLTQQEKEDIKQLIASGILTYTEIAGRYSVSAWTISTWAVKWGIRRGRGPLSPAHPMFKKGTSNV